MLARALCMNMCRDYTQASSLPVGRVTASFQRVWGKDKVHKQRSHAQGGHPGGQTRSQYLDKVSWSNFWILENKQRRNPSVSPTNGRIRYLHYLLALSLTNGTSGLIGDPVCPFVSYALLGGRPLIGNTSATSSYSLSKDRDIKFLIVLVTLGDFMPYSHKSQQHQQYYRHQHNHHYAIKRNATKHTELSSIQQACQSRSFARQRVVLNSLIT